MSEASSDPSGIEDSRFDFSNHFQHHSLASSLSTTMALFLRPNSIRAGLPRELLVACTISLQSRNFSVLNRPPPNYPGHIPLTRIEKVGLAVGSAIMSLRDPHRGGMSFTSLYLI